MTTYKSLKLFSQRPGSSARVYESTEHEISERRSKIPKMPRRTYSLERRGSSYSSKRSPSKILTSTTSMIPRPEWKKYCNKPCPPEKSIKKVVTPKGEGHHLESDRRPSTTEGSLERNGAKMREALPCGYQRATSSPEVGENLQVDDFSKFKSNVLRIPEYWTDAGQTVTNILKNAVSIVTKQYPSADVDAFEMEIQNILKATEAVKQEILFKTEAIINQADKLYAGGGGGEDEPSVEELREIRKKMEDLRREVHMRKNAFGDLLKCSSEMKQLVELEKTLQQNKTMKCSPRNSRTDSQKGSEGNNQKCGGEKKSKMETPRRNTRRRMKSASESCGNALRAPDAGVNEDEKSQTSFSRLEDKSSQTISCKNVEVSRREELSVLNDQILELHKLCKDHISKFKSFNLQIKLRGICNKAQNLSVSKEIQVLTEEKLQLAERNNKLYFYNKDLESAIKQKDLDLQQKDKLINQQKKLLLVRDELIEMLKSRCNIQDVSQL